MAHKVLYLAVILFISLCSTRIVNTTRSSNFTRSANSTNNAHSSYTLNSTRNNANSTSVTSVESLSRLLLLSEEICGYVDWCTVRTRPQHEQGYCCKQCSCSKDCERTSTCCPDHALEKYLNGNVYTNVSSLLLFLDENAYFVNNHTEDDSSVDTSQEDDIGVEHTATECIRSQLKSEHYYRPPGSSYYMVTSCLNASVDPHVRRMCESEHMDGSKYTEDSHVNHLGHVPVQSLKTGIIYRNKQCHECSSERHNSVVVWDVLISTYINPGNAINGLVTSIKELISHLMQMIYVEIVFEPGQSLRQAHSPQPCQKVDVKTCYKRDGYQDSGITAACERYVLPVYSLVNGTSKAFNNLACVYCSGSTTLDNCNGFYKWGQTPRRYVPFVGALTTTTNEHPHRSNSTATGETYENRLNMFFSPNCTPGFVYDNVLETCRRVYCPCGMIIHNSSCVPILGTVDAVYEIHVRLTPLAESKHDVGNALRQYIQTALESRDKLVIHYIAMCKATDPKNEDMAAVVSFSARDPVDYIELVKLADKLFNGMKQVAVSADETLGINMVIIDSYYEQGILYDITRRQPFECSVNQNQRNGVDTKTTFIIHKCVFCYQIEVMPSEIEPLKSRIVNARIKRTNIYLSKESLRYMLSNSSRAVLCSEYLLGQADRAHDDIGDSVRTVDPDQGDAENEKVSDDKYVIAMPVFIGFIILVTCLFRLARKHWTLPEEPTSNQIEMESIPG